MKKLIKYFQIFIDKAKEIFKKYNEDKKCNINNKRLLYDPNNKQTCYNFDDDKFAHGGFLCGDDGYWNNTCKKYYCDIGYYYDPIDEKCKFDPCTNEPNEKDINLNGEYSNTIIINEKNNTEYIFHINNQKYKDIFIMIIIFLVQIYV